MKIQTYTISKQALMDIPAKERDFFLLAGHFANEIIFLSKLLIITRDQPLEKIPAKAELTQALFVHKILAGKLCEGWQMIRRYYYGTGISKIYNELLAKDVQEAIKKLNRYFGKPNLISKVRNSYSFHYGPEKIEPTLKEMEDGDEFDMYIADRHINTLYYVSESVINKAMLHELVPNDLRASFDKLFQDIVEMHGLLLTFIHNFMTVAAGRHFVKTESNPVLEEIEIDTPSLEDLRLPFFVNTSSLAAGK